MTSGNLTRQQAWAIQEARNAERKSPPRLQCNRAGQYDGKRAPTCLPLCESCILKWAENGCPCP